MLPQTPSLNFFLLRDLYVLFIWAQSKTPVGFKILPNLPLPFCSTAFLMSTPNAPFTLNVSVRTAHTVPIPTLETWLNILFPGMSTFPSASSSCNPSYKEYETSQPLTEAFPRWSRAHHHLLLFSKLPLQLVWASFYYSFYVFFFLGVLVLAHWGQQPDLTFSVLPSLQHFHLS